VKIIPSKAVLSFGVIKKARAMVVKDILTEATIFGSILSESHPANGESVTMKPGCIRRTVPAS